MSRIARNSTHLKGSVDGRSVESDADTNGKHRHRHDHDYKSYRRKPKYYHHHKHKKHRKRRNSSSHLSPVNSARYKTKHHHREISVDGKSMNMGVIYDKRHSKRGGKQYHHYHKHRKMYDSNSNASGSVNSLNLMAYEKMKRNPKYLPSKKYFNRMPTVIEPEMKLDGELRHEIKMLYADGRNRSGNGGPTISRLHRLVSEPGFCVLVLMFVCTHAFLFL